MEIIGRITGNATVKETRSGKKVVEFQMALNDADKTTDGELKQFTTYIRCAWWRSPNAVKILKRGALIEVSGRLSVSAYTNKHGEAKGQIECRVNNFKLHAKGSTEAVQEITPA